MIADTNNIRYVAADDEAVGDIGGGGVCGTPKVAPLAHSMEHTCTYSAQRQFKHPFHPSLCAVLMMKQGEGLVGVVCAAPEK